MYFSGVFSWQIVVWTCWGFLLVRYLVTCQISHVVCKPLKTPDYKTESFVASKVYWSEDFESRAVCPCHKLPVSICFGSPPLVSWLTTGTGHTSPLDLSTSPSLNLPSIAPNQGSGRCAHGLQASLIILWSFNCCLTPSIQFHGCSWWASVPAALLWNSLNEPTFSSRPPLISARREGDEFSSNECQALLLYLLVNVVWALKTSGFSLFSLFRISNTLTHKWCL